MGHIQGVALIPLLGFITLIFRRYFLYLKPMELPSEALYMMVTVIVLAGAVAMVGYLTKSSRNFRSSRNRRARKQDNI